MGKGIDWLRRTSAHRGEYNLMIDDNLMKSMLINQLGCMPLLEIRNKCEFKSTKQHIAHKTKLFMHHAVKFK